VTTQTPGCTATFTPRKSVQAASAASAKAPARGRLQASDGPAVSPQSPTRALGDVFQKLLQLAGGQSAANLPSSKTAQKIRANAARGGSVALDGVGGRDAALLDYLMGRG
jgi:hypothetical protein